MERKPKDTEADDAKLWQSADHVGGVNETIGGVDPDIDANLMRLSGGP